LSAADFISQLNTTGTTNMWQSYTALPLKERALLNQHHLAKLLTCLLQSAKMVGGTASGRNESVMIEFKQQIRNIYEHAMEWQCNLKGTEFLDIQFYNTMLYCSMACKDKASFLRVIQDVTNGSNVAFNRISRNMILSGLNKDPDWLPLIKRYLRVLGFGDDVKNVMSHVAADTGTDPYFSSILIERSSRVPSPKTAKHLYQQLTRGTKRPNIVVFTSLLKALPSDTTKLKTELAFIFEEMRKHDVEPDKTFLTTLARLCLKHAMHSQFQRLVNQMKAQNMLDPQFFSEVIKHFVSKGSWSRAIKLINVCETCFNTVTLEHHTMLIRKLLQEGEVTTAKTLIRKVTQCGVPLDHTFFSVVIDGYFKNRQSTAALRMFHYMHTVGMTPNAHISHAMISFFKSLGSLAQCEALFEQAGSYGTRNERLFLVMMQVYLDRGLHTEALRCFGDMITTFPPDAGTFATLIRSFATHGDSHRCHQLYQHMTNTFCLLPTNLTFHYVLKAYLVDTTADITHATRWVFTESKKHRVALNTVVYNTLLKGYLIRDLNEDARSLYQHLGHPNITTELLLIMYPDKRSCK
jgi:pentatricopeptide repeat protein